MPYQRCMRCVNNIRRAHIAWAVHEQFKDVIPLKPWVDEIIIIDKKQLKRLSYWKQLWKLLHEKNFDISLDLQSIAKSAIVAGLSGAKNAMLIGNFVREVGL